MAIIGRSQLVSANGACSCPCPWLGKHRIVPSVANCGAHATPRKSSQSAPEGTNASPIRNPRTWNPAPAARPSLPAVRRSEPAVRREPAVRHHARVRGTAAWNDLTDDLRAAKQPVTATASAGKTRNERAETRRACITDLVSAKQAPCRHRDRARLASASEQVHGNPRDASKRHAYRAFLRRLGLRQHGSSAENCRSPPTELTILAATLRIIDEVA